MILIEDRRASCSKFSLRDAFFRNSVRGSLLESSITSGIVCQRAFVCHRLWVVGCKTRQVRPLFVHSTFELNCRVRSFLNTKLLVTLLKNSIWSFLVMEFWPWSSSSRPSHTTYRLRIKLKVTDLRATDYKSIWHLVILFFKADYGLLEQVWDFKV